MSRRGLLSGLMAAVVFALDRITKMWAVATLPYGEDVPGIASWVEWNLHYNPGAQGGMMSGQVEVLIAISAMATAALVWFVLWGPRKCNVWLQVGLGAMLGGTLGNLFDRVFYQHVIDFIHVVGSDVIFNVADKGIRWGLYCSFVGLLAAEVRGLVEREMVG
jgi:signal peptidase II